LTGTQTAPCHCSCGSILGDVAPCPISNPPCSVNIPSSNPPCSTPVKISTYEQFIPPCTPIRNVAQDTSDDEESTYSHGDRTCSSYKPSNLSQMEALEDDAMDISSFEEENVEEDIDQAVHGNKYVDAEKYIVFHDELLELFRCCPVCGGVASGSVVEKVGTMIKISWVCHVPECNFQRLWRSQPMIHHMPAGNLLVFSIHPFDRKFTHTSPEDVSSH